MKQKLTDFFQKLSPIFTKLGTNNYLQAISASMMATLGVIIVGSIAVLLMVFPIPEVKNFLESIGMRSIFVSVNNITINAISLYVAVFMGRNIVNKFMPEEDGVSSGIISLMCFLIITPLDKIEDTITVIPTTWLGPQGLFSAMIVGIIVGRTYVLFRQKGWTIKMPDGVPPMVTKVFDSLIPCLVSGAFFVIIARIFAGTSFGNVHQCIYSVIQEPLKGIGGTIGAVIFISVLQQILWFFGIHGTNVIMPIVRALWLAMDAENIAAVAAGQTPPNIVGYAFFATITWGGMALGLVLLMLRSKSKQYQQLGKVAIVPALFGITEPVIFGTPLVLNFKLAFPFIFNNAIVMAIAYVCTKIGLISICAGVQPVFGMPLGFYAAVQGSISIIIFQVITQLILSPILWYPWFKMAEKEAVARENGAVENA